MSFSKKLARFALSGALAMSMVLPNSLAVFQAKVNADSLYLRQSPGGAVITTLSKGTTVAVLNNSSSWYQGIRKRQGRLRQRLVPDRHHRNRRCTRHRHCKVLEQCKFPFGAEPPRPPLTVS